MTGCALSPVHKVKEIEKENERNEGKRKKKEDEEAAEEEAEEEEQRASRSGYGVLVSQDGFPHHPTHCAIVSRLLRHR